MLTLRRSYSEKQAVASTKPALTQPDLQQSFHFPKTFILLPSPENTAIHLSEPARDLKNASKLVYFYNLCHR